MLVPTKPSRFANWSLWKLGSYPPMEMGRQGPSLQVLAVCAFGRHTIPMSYSVCVQRMVPKYLQPTEEMVSGEMSRVKKPFKGIFISEKVGLHPRLPLPRREPVQKTLIHHEPQKRGSQRHFLFNFRKRDTTLNIPNCCSKFVKETKETAKELKARSSKHNRW